MSSELTPAAWAWAWSLGCLTALLSLTLLLPARVGALACWSLAALSAAVLWGDVLYFRSFGDFLTVSHLCFRQTEHQGPRNNARVHVARLARPEDLSFALDLALVLPALLLLSRSPALRSRRLALGPPALFLAGNALWLGLADPLSTNLMRTRQYNWAHVQRHGLVAYHVYDLYHWVRPRLVPPPEVARAVIESRLALSRDTIGPQHPHFGAARGCNVLLLQLESFQYFLLGMTVDGQEVTPFLNGLRRECLYADALDQTSHGSTSDCQFVVLNSLQPPSGGPFCFLFPTISTRALPRLLGERGWSTLHVMPYDGAFWNTRVMCEHFGFDRQLYLGDLPPAGRGEHVGWGLSDAALFERLGPVLRQESQPWFCHVTTTMMHFPFEELRPHQRLLRLPPELEKTMAGRYLQLARFRDLALHLLVKRLQEQGWWDRTLLVMVGDHRCRMPDSELKRLGVTGPAPVLNRIPWLLHVPGGTVRGDLPAQSGQLDIAPTLLQLLGLADLRHAFLGRNALAGAHASASVYGYVTDGKTALWAGAGPREGTFSRLPDMVPLGLSDERAGDLRRQLDEESGISDTLLYGDRILDFARGSPADGRESPRDASR